MNGPQHYAEAERLLDTSVLFDNADAAVAQSRAQVHATLALAAAVATDHARRPLAALAVDLEWSSAIHHDDAVSR